MPSPEKRFIILEWLGGAGRMHTARPVSLLAVVPLFLARSCRLEEFRSDVLVGRFSWSESSGGNGFSPSSASVFFFSAFFCDSFSFQSSTLLSSKRLLLSSSPFP